MTDERSTSITARRNWRRSSGPAPSAGRIRPSATTTAAAARRARSARPTKACIACRAQADGAASDEGSRVVLRLPRRLGPRVPGRRLQEEAVLSRDHRPPERRASLVARADRDVAGVDQRQGERRRRTAARGCRPRRRTTEAASRVPQRADGIDARRPAARDVAGRQDDHRQRGDPGSQRDRIEGTDAEERRPRQQPETHRQQHAGDDARHGRGQRLAHDETTHVARPARRAPSARRSPGGAAPRTTTPARRARRR